MRSSLIAGRIGKKADKGVDQADLLSLHFIYSHKMVLSP